MSGKNGSLTLYLYDFTVLSSIMLLIMVDNKNKHNKKRERV